MSLQVLPHLTKRAPDAGDSGAIPSSFLRLSIFPVGRRSAARPSAGNANRWAVPCIIKSKGDKVMKKSIGLVFLVFMFLTVLLSGCAPVSTPIPPTFTSVPPTDTPIPPATPTKPPTSTPIPPTPTVAPPSVIVDYLNDVQVVKTHAFDNMNGWGTWNSETGYVSDGVFNLTGQKGWSSGLYYSQKFGAGYGVSLKFKTTKNTDWQSGFVLMSGNWDTDSFRSIGVYNGKRPKVNLFQGKQSLIGGTVGGNFSPKADTWYNLLLAVGKNENYLVVIWNPEDPSKQLVYREKLGEKWTGLQSQFTAQANIGETVYIDDFLFLTFSDFK